MPIIIGVCGGSASGKTSVAKKINDTFQGKNVQLLSMDSFYRDLTAEENKDIPNFNFDHPNAFDLEEMKTVIGKLQKGEPTKIPLYDFSTNSRNGFTELGSTSPDVLIVEGILIFHTAGLRDLFDLKIFVHEDEDTRLIRRLRRDTTERGRTLDSVLVAWERFVKPAYNDFIDPSKRFADIIVPRGVENTAALTLLCEHISLHLANLSIIKVPK